MNYFTLAAIALNGVHMVHADGTHSDHDPSHDPIHHVHGSHVECPLPKTAMDVLRCVQQDHPNVKRAKNSLEASVALTDVAGQLPNPEFELQTVYGKSL